LKGVMPAVTTKFTKHDRLDLHYFEINIRAQIDAGVNGIILGGTLGEASTLTNEEKKILVERTVELVKGSVPVIINIAEQSTKGAIEAAQRAQDYGADGLMLLPPMRYKADNRETVTYFQKIASGTKLPIMIYNNLGSRDGVEIVIEIFAKFVLLVDEFVTMRR